MDSLSGGKRSCPEGFANSDEGQNNFHVVNALVQPLLTDLYQITMAYAYWKNWKHCDRAVFDLFFRRNPFQGEFTIFGGLEECLRFISDFRFTDSGLSARESVGLFCSNIVIVANYGFYLTYISYLKQLLPGNIEPEFFGYMRSLSAKDVTVYAIAEGSLVFPRVPLMRIEGPLPVVQLMETTLLNLVNFASLVATNAARYRLAAGPERELMEFGLRRAQGPDGGISASRYSYIGGIDATSNVLAGKLFGIPVKGTHAHAFVSSFSDLSEVKSRTLQPSTAHGDTNDPVVLLPIVEEYVSKVSDLLGVPKSEMNEGERAAFIAYAVSFPSSFLALVDTYDVISSGLPNFCAVALALNQLGYHSVGVRIDSGDLAYLSTRVDNAYRAIAEKFCVPWFTNLKIIASNQINEETILSLNSQGHNITTFAVGTNLVTCQTQPALGCVFKVRRSLLPLSFA
jgi:nicotinate phosphoribosyltransferase